MAPAKIHNLNVVGKPPTLCLVQILLLILLLLQHHQPTQVNASNLLRVLALDTFTLKFSPNSIAFPKAMQTMTAYIAAMDDFNSRSVNLPPSALSLIPPTCSLNLSLVSVCDMSRSGRRAVTAVEEFALDADVLLGFSFGDSAIPGTSAANAVMNAVTISSQVREAQLGDGVDFPLFARTQIADDLYANLLAQFLVSLNVSHFVSIYVDDANSSPLREALEASLVQMNAELTAFPFTPEDFSSIDTALSQVASTAISIIVCTSYTSDLLTLVADSAFAHGLLGPEHLWIFVDFDNPPSFSENIASTNASLLFRGSLFVQTLTLDQTSFTDYATNVFPTKSSLIPDANLLLPPHGHKNDSSQIGCINDALDAHLPTTAFDSNSLLSLSDFDRSSWARSYDAVVALGVAACIAQPGTGIPTSSNLISALLNLEMTGLSGNVMFDNTTGNRLIETASLNIINIPEDASSSFIFSQNGVNVGKYDFDSQTWEFNQTAASFKASTDGGNPFTEFVTPNQDFNYLPFGFKILGYVEVGILEFYCLFCGFWLVKNRRHRVVRSSQGNVLLIAVVGLALAGWAILALTVDDSFPDSFNPSTACMMGPFVFVLGFFIAFAALVGKTYRAYTIFNRSALVRTGVSVNVVYGGVGAVAAVTLALLLAWSIASPLTWVRSVDFVDVHGLATATHGSCIALTDVSTGFGAFFCVAYFIILLGTLILAQKVKNLPEEFQEARWLTLALTALLQVFIVGAAVTITVYQRQIIGRFVVLSSVVFLSVLLLLFFVFYPKMTYARAGGVVDVFNIKVMLGSVSVIATMDRVQSTHSKVSVPEMGTSNNSAEEVGRAVSSQQQLQSQGRELREIELGLEVPSVRKKFEKFAERNYVLENFHFVVDVFTFQKESKKGQTDSWKKETARGILQLYLRPNSILEVNVSDTMRAEVEKTLADHNTVPSSDVFDKPVREVLRMLAFGPWIAFKQEGGLFGIVFPELQSGDEVSMGSQAGGGKSTNNVGTGRDSKETSPVPSRQGTANNLLS